MDRYAVIGNPIAHSKSPQIHSAFAQQTGQDLEYTRMLVEIDHLAEAVAEFQKHQGKGLNITVPFKQDAWQLASSLSDRAERAGAVNTLVLYGENDYYGDTTDGVGLVNDLKYNHDIHLNARHILILGAGGAVRGVLEPILQQFPSQLVIANRTVDKATQLAKEFSDLGAISACGFDELSNEQFDLIINGTSASLSGELPPLPDQLLKQGASCYDMMYAAEATPFMRWGRQQGAQTCLDGLGMLVEQAAESFYLWRGVRPETAPVIRQIRKNLSQA
ncbi:MAG: shikimate dehydrogenase [Gammaproteobacteria bacterium]|nr:shikimate dehydrogenase [Gammaproteobacteria bacterium]